MNIYPITNDDFNRVIRNCNKWIKIRRNYNKRFLNKKVKLSDGHINFMQSKVNTYAIISNNCEGNLKWTWIIVWWYWKW